MSESKWAALVYGRTYEADFRFIVTPEDFTSGDIDWAWNYIRVTTRKAEKLAERPRWSLFRNERHCVVGVTCMVRDLIGDLAKETPEDRTRDFKGRPLYAFVGYVAKVDSSEPPLAIPNYSDSNLGNFQPLYDYVSQKWREKPYDISKNKVVSEYQKEFDSPDFATEDANAPPIDPKSLNYDSERGFLWPCDDNQKLWFAASQCQGDVSLCLGLTSQKDILDGAFINGTAFDVDVMKMLKKNQPSQTLKNPENNTVRPSNERESMLAEQQHIQATQKEVVEGRGDVHSPEDWIKNKGKNDVEAVVNFVAQAVAILSGEREDYQSNSFSEPPGRSKTRNRTRKNSPSSAESISPLPDTASDQVYKDSGFKPKKKKSQKESDNLDGSNALIDTHKADEVDSHNPRGLWDFNNDDLFPSSAPRTLDSEED